MRKSHSVCLIKKKINKNKTSSEARKETLNVENISYVRLIPTCYFKVVVTLFLASRNSWAVWMQGSVLVGKEGQIPPLESWMANLRPSSKPCSGLFPQVRSSLPEVLHSGMLLHSKCWSILHNTFGNPILSFCWENISSKVAWKADTCSLLWERAVPYRWSQLCWRRRDLINYI